MYTYVYIYMYMYIYIKKIYVSIQGGQRPSSSNSPRG